MRNQSKVRGRLRVDSPLRSLSRMVGVAVMVLAGLASTDAVAQNVGRISGTITDATTRRPLPGANVIIPGRPWVLLPASTGTTTS
jgi:hypothetical protein